MLWHFPFLGIRRDIAQNFGMSCQPEAFSETGLGDTPARSVVGPDTVAEEFSSARNRALLDLHAEKMEPARMAVRDSMVRRNSINSQYMLARRLASRGSIIMLPL